MPGLQAEDLSLICAGVPQQNVLARPCRLHRLSLEAVGPLERGETPNSFFIINFTTLFNYTGRLPAIKSFVQNRKLGKPQPGGSVRNN